MLRKSLLLLIICCAPLLGGQDLKVKINMKDGNITEGKLLKISSEGVEINPGGSVKFRFIPAERIKTVEIIELNKTVEYPLEEANIPLEVKEYEENVTAQQIGFPKFLGFGSFGYTSVDGEYYEGLNSGTVFRFGLHYYLPDSDPTCSRFIIGFSYNHSSVKGDPIYGFEPKLYLNEYSLEFGITTRRFEAGHYLYLLTSVAVVTNELSIPLSSGEYTYSETKGALRLEGDISFYLGNKFSALISLGYDIVLAKSESNSYSTYSYNNPNMAAAGGIFNVSLGLAYGF